MWEDFAPSSDGQAQQLIAAAASPDAERLESLLRWPLNPEAAEKPGRTALRKLMRKLLAADTTGRVETLDKRVDSVIARP